MSISHRQASSELTALQHQSDDDIDLSDIPELTDASRAVIGKFYRPIKKPVTIRLDADVLGWLRIRNDAVHHNTRVTPRTARRIVDAVEEITGRLLH